MPTYVDDSGVTYNVTTNTLLGIPTSYNVAISGSSNPSINQTLTNVPLGRVATTNGTSIGDLLSFGANTYVVPPTVNANISIGASGLALNTYYIGGNARIDSAASFPGTLSTIQGC